MMVSRGEVRSGDDSLNTDWMVLDGRPSYAGDSSAPVGERGFSGDAGRRAGEGAHDDVDGEVCCSAVDDGTSALDAATAWVSDLGQRGAEEGDHCDAGEERTDQLPGEAPCPVRDVLDGVGVCVLPGQEEPVAEAAVISDANTSEPDVEGSANARDGESK